jgi:hypothetical protein
MINGVILCLKQILRKMIVKWLAKIIKIKYKNKTNNKKNIMMMMMTFIINMKIMGSRNKKV